MKQEQGYAAHHSPDPSQRPALAVQNLQAGLLLLLPANVTLSDDANRQALIDKIIGEQRNDFYGDATTEGVARFQAQRTAFDLPLDTGEQVDEPTAVAMNRMLQQLGLFEPRPTPF